MRRWDRVFLLLLCVAALVALPALGTGYARVTSSRPNRYLVLIVMDGFRPDYLQLAPMRHIRALMRTGMTYTNAWVGQLESETPTGHATIVTGVYPRKHGVIGFGWRDATGSNFTWMPTDMGQLNAGDMEHLIEGGGVPTISDLVHRYYPGSRTVSMSGEKYYAADAMGTGADYILYGKATGNRINITPIGQHIPPASTHFQAAGEKAIAYPDVQDMLVAHLAVRMLQTVRPRAMLVNLPGTDIEGHVTGGAIDPTDMRHQVMSTDAAIATIINAYRRAGLYKQTDFVVTADHGMLPNSHLVPFKSMYAGVRATKALNLEDDLLHTAGFIYLRVPQQAPAVASYMAAQHYPGVEGALYRVPTPDGFTYRALPSTAAALGPQLTQAYLDLANTMAAPAGPDVLLPYTEDTMGLRVPHATHWGDHGGLSWLTQHIPLVISGPGVRHGTSTFPAQLVDIAPTIERLLDMPVPRGVDGVVLSDALQQPSGAEVDVQRSAAARRLTDVRALQLHSQQQHGIVISPPHH